MRKCKCVPSQTIFVDFFFLITSSLVSFNKFMNCINAKRQNRKSITFEKDVHLLCYSAGQWSHRPSCEVTRMIFVRPTEWEVELFRSEKLEKSTWTRPDTGHTGQDGCLQCVSQGWRSSPKCCRSPNRWICVPGERQILYTLFVCLFVCFSE